MLSEAVASTNGDNAGENNDNPFGPIFANGKYNDKAHHYSEERRVERDLTIPKIVDELGNDICDFVDVETTLGGTQFHLIYHPNPKGDIGCDLMWDRVPAISKGNGGKFYKEISNKKVTWYYLILTGDVFGLVQSTFEEDLLEGYYKKELPKFAKKASKFIFDHPHKNFGSYGCYLLFFVKLIQATDSIMTNSELQNVAITISFELKRVLQDSKDRNGTPLEIYKKVRDVSTKLTIQDCSKAVHYKISLIDINAQNATRGLDDLDKLVEKEREEERLVKQAKMEAMRAAATKRQNQRAIDSSPVTNKKPLAIEEKKRKANDDEPLDGNDSKRPRIEELNEDEDHNDKIVAENDNDNFNNNDNVELKD